MRSVIAVWRLLRLTVHVAHGLRVIRGFDRLDAADRHAQIGWWSRKTLLLLGVELQVQGEALEGAKLVVANHVSWLDIAAVQAVLPEARFVSKADVKHWPVVGGLVVGAGTLFIERTSKRDALRVVHQAAEALKDGDTVAFFPEGTTGSGPELLPFHGNLLQAAIATEAAVLPLLLRWPEPGHRFSPSARFTGQTSLAQSLWRIASARGLAVQVKMLPSHAVLPDAERRVLADQLREQIGAALA